MFKFNELFDLHLEITNNCQASCPMCSRNLNGGPVNPLIQKQDWSLEDFKTIMTEEVLMQIGGYYMCGNFGDPMLNNDALDMIEYSVSVNPELNIRFHTNGSARTIEWWQRLAKVMPKSHNVVFALDGLEDTHSLYRVGTNFNTIIENARAFINAGGHAEWAFIRFKHNQHQVEAAQQMAKDLGFSQFTFKNSSRFLLEPKVQVVDRKNNPLHIIEPATDTPLKFIDKKTINAYKEIVAASTISCQSVHEKQLYIDAYGTVLPCCWTASTPYNHIENNDAMHVKFEMLQQYHDMVYSLGGIEKINGKNNSVKTILESTEFQSVWDAYWTTKKLIVCARTCGVAAINDFGKSKDQHIDMIDLKNHD